MVQESIKLTEGSIFRHLVRLSIPASMGMVFTTLYNLTDFWFAGLLSDEALAGVSIAGSVFFLLLSVGIGMQTGTSAVVAPEVGQDNREMAARYTDNAISLGIVFSLFVMLLGWWLMEPLVLFLGAEADVAPLALQYLSVVFFGAVLFTLSFVAAGALMAHGDTKSNRDALVVGFFANLVLNPLLTFVLGLGVAGLAMATVLIKGATAVYLFYVLKRIQGRYNRLRFDFSLWLALLRQVLPASFNMLTIILGGFITVSLIGRFGSDSVAGYAVGLRLEQVLLLPALGLNSAVMAIAGQNFGAGHSERVMETYTKGLQVGFFMALAFIPVMIFLSPQMMGFFSQNPQIIETGTTYLRIDALAYFPYVVLFLSTACLQAMKKPLFPMVLGIMRQLALPATINYLLIVVYNLPMITVFLTIIIVVSFSSIVSHLFTRHQLQGMSVASGEGRSVYR